MTEKHTRLTFEGFPPDEVTVEFLLALMDVSEEHGLDVVSVGISRREFCCPEVDTNQNSE